MPIQHFVVAMIEDGFVNVRMCVVGTAAAYAYPNLARYTHGNLGSHDTLSDLNEKIG